MNVTNNRVNVKKIKALMGENDHTKAYLSNILGITPPALRRKLENITEFKASEIKIISEIYSVPVDDLYY